MVGGVLFPYSLSCIAVSDSSLILALETSARGGSVALAQGERLLIEREVPADSTVTASIQPTIQQLLADARRALADVNIVAYSHGPGSFTGLRTAATVVRSLCHALSCRAIQVPTLRVIAENLRGVAPAPKRVAVLLDARRDRSFAQCFEWDDDSPKTSVALSEPTMVQAPAWLATLPTPFACVGTGATAHRSLIESFGGSMADESMNQPRARIVAMLAAEMASRGEFTPAAGLVPLYIRPPECEEVYESRRAAAVARRIEQSRD